MSYAVFFSMSSGLSGPIRVPAGSKAEILQHIEKVERALGLKRSKYKDNPVHWDHFNPAIRDGFPEVEDKLLCETVTEHNRWVRMWYEDLAKWAEKPPAGRKETITPKQSERFWFGFQMLEVEPGRWTRDYYRERMEHLYEVMRGRPDQGASFDERLLTPRQAAQVINIFSEYLDDHDLRLDVPNGRDYLASSYDGGYTWCETCGPVGEGDEGCCKKRKCPIREERER
jgi:hypothetical protein